MIRIVNRLENFLKPVFLIGLFISVFIFWPNSEIPYEIPKVWFIARWIEILVIITFFTLNKLKKEKIDTVLIALMLAFLGVSIVSSYLGVNFNKSIVGNYYRGDGLVTLFHYFILYFVIVLYSTKNWISGFIKVVSVSGVILSLISVLQWLFNAFGITSIQTWDGGLGNVFGNPNFLAGYLVVTLPFVGYFVYSTTIKRKKYFALLCLLVQIFGIVLTNAWVGYFGIIIFLFLWLSLNYKKYWFQLIFIGLLLLVLTLFKFISYQRSLETPISINPESRVRILMKSILAVKERPLFGYGWANFDVAFERVDYPIHMDQDVYVDKAHSSFLEILTTTGILGLIVYLSVISKVFVNLFRRNTLVYKYVTGVFILLILHMQTNVISVSEEVLFWVIVGLSTKETS